MLSRVFVIFSPIIFPRGIFINDPIPPDFHGGDKPFFRFISGGGSVFSVHFRPFREGN